MATARVVLKQYRFEVGAAVLGAAAVMLLWLYMEVRLVGIDLPVGCMADPSHVKPALCEPALSALRPIVASFGARILEVMRVLPFAIGLLTGVPIVARELETRTAQTAWSLNGSRRRWLARQGIVVAVPTLLAVAVVAFAAAMVEALRQGAGDGGAVLNIGQYGIPAIIRAAASFTLGMSLGALLGRSVPALVLGATLCLALTFALGLARDNWLAQQPAGPIPDGTTTSVTTGWAHRTPQGRTITNDEAMALVPPDVAAQDAGQVQPVNSSIWLENQGYGLVAIGVTQETAMGWVPYDMLIFGVVGLASLGMTVLVIERRRPV